MKLLDITQVFDLYSSYSPVRIVLRDCDELGIWLNWRRKNAYRILEGKPLKKWLF
jgi:hypothetical protein